MSSSHTSLAPAAPGYADLLARLVEASGDFRVLRRLGLVEGVCAAPSSPTRVGVVLDVETTGLDRRRDRIIELAFRRLRFDDDGVVTKLDRPYAWLEDPGRPLDPAVVAMTGLTDAVLSGRRIDDAAATALLRSAHVLIAFNAAFDRKFVERRLPVAGLPWACAMAEVDWRARGFDGNGRALGWLLTQCGLFNPDSHRAAGDVDATIAILKHRAVGGGTALLELLETAAQPTWRISAVGAHFDVKEDLRQRGYRWDADESVWSREVPDRDREAELAWLAGSVYAGACRPRTDGPAVREVTWLDRHA